MQRLFEEYEAMQKEQERQRKMQKKLMKQIAEVQQREINVVAREMSLHNNNKMLESSRYNKPRPPKRLGKFKRSKLLKLGGISEPSGLIFKLFYFIFIFNFILYYYF